MECFMASRQLPSIVIQPVSNIVICCEKGLLLATSFPSCSLSFAGVHLEKGATTAGMAHECYVQHFHADQNCNVQGLYCAGAGGKAAGAGTAAGEHGRCPPRGKSTGAQQSTPKNKVYILSPSQPLSSTTAQHSFSSWLLGGITLWAVWKPMLQI